MAWEEGCLRRMSPTLCNPVKSRRLGSIFNISLESLGRDDVISSLVCSESHLGSCPQHQTAALQNDLSNHVCQVVFLPPLKPESSSLIGTYEETLTMAFKALQDSAPSILSSSLSTIHT